MKFKRVIFLCVSLIVAISLCACNEKTADLSGFEQFTFSEEFVQPAFAEIVYLVVPDGASGALVSKAESLALKICEQTGVQTIVKYDSQPVMDTESTLKILIGNTNDIISAESLRGFREDDYICRYERGAIVLGGKSESATMLAMDKFEADILTCSSNAFFMSEDAHFEHFGEYALDSLCINGFNIYDFTIVYGNDGAQGEIADLLGRYIEIKSGYVVDVKRYDKLDTNVAKTIYLHIDEEIDPNTAVIDRNADNFEIRAGDLYSLSGAVAKFASVIIPEGASGDVSVNVDSYSLMAFEDDSASLSLFALSCKNEAPLELVLSLSADIRRFDGDMLCLLGVGDELIDEIEYSAPDGYSALICDEIQLFCREDDADASSLEVNGQAKTVKFISSNKEQWTVFIADSFDEAVSYIGKRGIAFLKEEIADTSDMVKVGEVAVGTEGELEKYFVYTSRAINADVRVELTGGAQDDFSVSRCTLDLAMKYHGDFLKLKDAVE
jgi:hypothetical protein